MLLRTPIYTLKRRAKAMARSRSIALHRALDEVAQAEGFRAWSHLAAHTADQSPARRMLAGLAPGTLHLLGARPGQGKSLLALELAARADQIGRQGYFFSLDFHDADIAQHLRGLGMDVPDVARRVVFDTSDAVRADYIIAQVDQQSRPVLVVVDYLQALDQKRSAPDLEVQMRSLRRFAQGTGAIVVVISQIDRRFDLSGKTMPEVSDIRLPNPLNLAVFDSFNFLHDGRFSAS